MDDKPCGRRWENWAGDALRPSWRGSTPSVLLRRMIVFRASARAGALGKIQRVKPSSLFVLDPLRDERWRQLSKAPASSVFHRRVAECLASGIRVRTVVYTNGDPSSAAIALGIVFCKVKSWLTGRRWYRCLLRSLRSLVGSSAEFDAFLLQVRESVRSEKCSTAKFGRCARTRGATMSGKATNTFGMRSICGWHRRYHRNLHSSVRRRIRRAEREALTYEQGNSERLLGQFTSWWWRPGGEIFTPQPIQWISQLDRESRANLAIRVRQERHAHRQYLDPNHKKPSPTSTVPRCPNAPVGGVSLLLWNTSSRPSGGYEALYLGRSDTARKLAAFKDLGRSRSDSDWRTDRRILTRHLPKKSHRRCESYSIECRSRQESALPPYWLSEGRNRGMDSPGIS